MLRPQDQLLLLSHRHPSEFLAQIYDPVVCLVVQGEKQVMTSERRHTIGAGEFLVVTHDMPVLSGITKASPHSPYLALILSLDWEVLAELQHDAGEPPALGDKDPYALRVGDAENDLVDAFVRYLRALEAPNSTAVLLPLVSREIHYRVLNTRAGQTLRRLTLGQQPAAAAVARAIGRKHISQTRTIFGPAPKPRATISTGTRAGFGSTLRTSRVGVSAGSSLSKPQKRRKISTSPAGSVLRR